MSNGFLAEKEIVHGALTQLAGGTAGTAAGNIKDLCSKLGLTEPQIRQAFKELESDAIIEKPYIEGDGKFSIELLKLL